MHQGESLKMKRGSDNLSRGSLAGEVVAAVGPLVYAEDANGSYYLTNPSLKLVVEDNGGKFQQGPANTSTTIIVKGSLEKDDTWESSKKHTALHVQMKLTKAGGRNKALRLLSFVEFSATFNLAADIEPELLWAFTDSPNYPPPEKRMKNFLGIGNTCVVHGSDHEKSLGIVNGYSRGRYVLHTYGHWPDDNLLIKMNERHQERKEAKEAKQAKCEPIVAD